MHRPVLEIQVGDKRVRKVIAGPTVTIGRDPANSIAFNDKTMSRFHCVIEMEDGKIILRDLNSSGGTTLNSKRMTREPLRDGDQFRAGRIGFTLRLEKVARAGDDIEKALEQTKTSPASEASDAAAEARRRAATSAEAASKPRTRGPRWSLDDVSNLEPGAAPGSAARTDPPPRAKAMPGEEPEKEPRQEPVPQAPPQHAPAPPITSADHHDINADTDVPSSEEFAMRGMQDVIADAPPPPASDSPLRSPMDDVFPNTGEGGVSDERDMFKPEDVHEIDRRAPQLAGQNQAIQFGGMNDPDKSEKQNARELAASALNHEHVLTEMSEALPDRDLVLADLQLVDFQGRPVPTPATGSMVEAVQNGKEGLLLLMKLLLLAQRIRATDVHMEPHNDREDVRLRVDGVMVNILAIHPAIGKRMHRIIKLLVGIDIAQNNAIQEGHFSIDVPDRRIHFRISFTPSLHGQKLVIRVLDVANAPQKISQLGMPQWMEREVRGVVNRDTGMVLVCGPTGSGKTSTLYALLRAIDRSTRNVITIEDPVEYEIDGTTQLPINEVHGQSFSSLLRSVLRQDPDVLLIGEVRDTETAKIAMQAALTGHLVFSTVHARDAVGTIFRLIDLGVERYLVGSALNLVVAQRLGRLLCQECKRERPLEPHEVRLFAANGIADAARTFEPRGCARCLETGYRGRKAFFEMLSTTDQVRDLILSTPQIQEIRKAVRANLFASLQETGLKLVEQGLTSFDEIERVVGATS